MFLNFHELYISSQCFPEKSNNKEYIFIIMKSANNPGFLFKFGIGNGASKSRLLIFVAVTACLLIAVIMFQTSTSFSSDEHQQEPIPPIKQDLYTNRERQRRSHIKT